MCGIHGFIGRDEDRVHGMIKATRRRGPDGDGVFSDDRVTFGHNLLAITETSDQSRQPFVSSDRRYALVYNGEIYNYIALRENLEKRGRRFRTNSDTEVLFAGLQEEGISFLEKLDGMYALAFYDRDEKTLLLARDPLGMKPLYYTHSGKNLVFSSEIRGLVAYGINRVLDHEALQVYLDVGYVPGQKTLLNSVKKVVPGEVLTVNLDTGISEQAWIRLFSELHPFDLATFKGLLGSSVRSHTMGLRPWGLYLSGGLDSSVVLHELSQMDGGPIKTYTTRFDVDNDSYNEDADIAAESAKRYGTDHHELLVKSSDYIEALKKTIEVIEGPRHNISIAQTFLLADLASNDVTVMLGGDGGDELLLGYPHHKNSVHLSNRYGSHFHWMWNTYYTMRDRMKGRLSWQQSYHLDRSLERWLYFRRLRESTDNELFSDPRDYTGIVRYLSSVMHPSINGAGVDMENAVAGFDRMFWLADEDFLRADKIAMHFGMEGRFPMVSRPVVEYLLGVSSSEKLAGEESKGLLRKGYKDVLSQSVLRKKKSGWRAPAVEWMDEGLLDYMLEVIAPGYYSSTEELFNFSKVRERAKSRQWFKGMKKVMPIVTFQIWARQLGVTL